MTTEQAPTQKAPPLHEHSAPPKTAGPEHVHDHDHGHDHEHGHGHDHGHHHAAKAAGGGTILTVRAASGLSGDILLAGLASMAGLHNKELHALTKELNLPALEGSVTLEARSVNNIAGVGCRVDLPHEHAHRTLTDIQKIIENSTMPDTAKALAQRTFTLLAEAEAAVHGKKTQEVTFHEVGALDSIVDICLACRIFTLLQTARFICSPLPLADGCIHCAHGHIPCPAPAVLRLLEGVPVSSFPGTGETITPTAIALLKAWGTEFGAWPNMRITKTCITYGSKVWDNAPNGAVWALGTL